MERRHFQKSMTAIYNHRQWQDVYHVPHEGMLIYVKFTDDAVTEFAVVSFKER
jgi:motility quorum-sensing regulator / GCU-specific mRNA interferase toxin